MSNLARAAALSLTTVLTLAGVSACGSSDDASSSTPPSTSSSSPAEPTSAPTDTTSSDDTTTGSGDAEALCQAFANTPSDPGTTDVNALISAAHDYGDQIAAAGVPSDMSQDAQKGLADYISVLQNLDADKAADLQNMSDPSSLFGDDQAEGAAFFQYLAENCQDAFSGATP